ncbi:MAG TPA: serine hydrolase domain-containing protein [Caulobacteraceae bacterium]|nr:serine hydrolase domain-containing protein [Caulobacteraceae bacterium]
MSTRPTRRRILTGSLAASALAANALAASAAARDRADPRFDAVRAYARSQHTTGFLVISDGRTLVEDNWPAPQGDPRFRLFVYGATPEGALLEDVASQQKSFVSVLAAAAVDRGLLEVARPVSDYLGAGWSKASPAQEAQISVLHVLTMSSGLTTGFAHAAPPGSVFLYNTPVYAITKQVLAAAAKRSLEAITQDWLTGPAQMRQTSWRQRPAVFAAVGNPTGLVTSPRDIARLGMIVLGGGVAQGGARIVSEASLAAMFVRSPANPAYGRLWWLNGGAFCIRPPARRTEGPLIPAAPPDLVAALGLLDRKLYVVPSRRLIVVRTGAGAPDKDFDQQLWARLMPALA